MSVAMHQKGALAMTAAVRAEAIRFCECAGEGDAPWREAADLLRAGWSPGEDVTPGQRLYVAVETARRLLIAAGAEVTTAVSAATAGPVGVTYTITAAGDVP